MIAVCSNAAFNGVFLVLCNLPNTAGMKPSRPAAQTRCVVVRNPPKVEGSHVKISYKHLSRKISPFKDPKHERATRITKIVAPIGPKRSRPKSNATVLLKPTTS
jgi:hypothetical protein